jgi:hypothetical protein
MTPSTTSWVVEPWSGETPLCFHGGTPALSKFQVEMDARHKTQHRHVFASWSFWRSVTWSSFIRPTNTTFKFYLQLATSNTRFLLVEVTNGPSLGAEWPQDFAYNSAVCVRLQSWRARSAAIARSRARGDGRRSSVPLRRRGVYEIKLYTRIKREREASDITPASHTPCTPATHPE